MTAGAGTPGPLLRSGSVRDFRALGAAGSPAYRVAPQLLSAARRHLGDAVADLLAVPRLHDDGEGIDWYAPRPGEVVPWSAATPAQRAAARATLDAAREHALARGRALEADPQGDRQLFGRLLACALEIPGEEHIFLVDGRPVLTFWGFRASDIPEGRDAPGALAGDPPPPAPDGVTPAPVAPPPRGRWWPWALLAALLLLLLFLLLFDRCRGGPWPPGEARTPAPAGTEAPASPPPTPALTPTAALPGTVALPETAAEYHTDVVQADASTPGIPTTPGAADLAGTPAGAEGAAPATRVPAAPAATPPGALPSPAATAPDAAAPTAETPGGTPAAGARETPDTVLTPGAAPRPPEGTPLIIPQSAVDEESTDFLDGRWRSITGLQDRRGNPVELEYDFERGRGAVSLRRAVGGVEQTCTGQVTSTLRDGRLQIEQRGIRCPDGSSFQDSTVRCTIGPDRRAVCTGVNADGSTYDVHIVQ